MTPVGDEQPPSSTDTLQQIRPRRWPVVVVLLGVLGLAVGAFVFFTDRAARASRDREARAWSTLQRCLMGPEALEAGQAPSARLRRIQLTAVGIPYRARGQDAWPGWCSSRAHALHEALREAGHEQKPTPTGAKDLSYWAEHLGKTLQDHPYPEGEIGPLVDALWTAAKAQDLAPSDADEVPATPAQASPLTVDALKSVPPVAPASFPLSLVHTERVPSDAVRLVAVGPQAQRAPFVCTARATGDAMACAKLPSALDAVQARLLGATDDAASPLVFAAPSGEAGVYRSSDGTLVDQGLSFGAYARADGSTVDLAWDHAHDQLRLRRARPGQPARDTLFKLDGVTDDAQVALLSDAVIWAANGSIGVRHVLDGDAAMGATATVAPVPEGGIRDREPLRGCRSGSSLTLLVRGEEQDTVTVDTGDAWSTPATFPAVQGRFESFTCHGSESSFTVVRALNEAGWVEGHVTQVRCTPGECATKSTELAKVFPDVKETMPTSLAATGLDGKLLLVWQAGDVGGLRLRLAAQDHIEEPSDVVVYDDRVQDGLLQGASTLLGWEIYPRGSYAVLLVSTTAGVHALRIDSAGKVTPLRVAW